MQVLVPIEDMENVGPWVAHPSGGPLFSVLTDSPSNFSTYALLNVGAAGQLFRVRMSSGGHPGPLGTVTLKWSGANVGSVVTNHFAWQILDGTTYVTSGNEAIVGNNSVEFSYSIPVADFGSSFSNLFFEIQAPVVLGGWEARVYAVRLEVSDPPPPAPQYYDPAGIASAEAFGTFTGEGPREVTGMGGIASAEAFGTLIVDSRPATPLIDLLSDPDQQIQKLFIARVGAGDADPEGEILVVLSSHGYATLGDGAGLVAGIADHFLFPPALVSSHQVKLSLLTAGGFTTSSLEAFGNIIVGWADGELDALAGYSWEDRPLEVWAGPYQFIGPSFSSFSQVFIGTVESVDWDLSRLNVRSRDLKQALVSKEINEEAYLGFGTALEFRAVNDKVTIADASSIEPATILFEPMIQPTAPLRNGVLASKGGDSGYLFRVNADGSASFFDRGLTNDLHTASGLVQPGVPTRLSFRGDGAGLKIYVNGTVAASNAVAYGGPTNSSSLVLGRRS